MQRLFSLLLLTSALAMPAFGDGQIDGLWVGYYSSGPTFNESGTVPVSMVLVTNANRINGRLIEVQTFGNEPSAGLAATLDGSISNDVVSLIKTYDGSGGVRHTVHLNLVFAPGDPNPEELVDSDSLAGEWRIDSRTSGEILLFRLH